MALLRAHTSTEEAASLKQENTNLRNQLAELSQTIIGISQNLDADAALQAVVNGA